MLDQTFRDFELIVVDDGSTDNTPHVLEQYRGRVRLVRRENGGVSAARNSGIASSAGELIAFLDSDDQWLPGKLAEQVRFFDEHPDALICQTEEIWIRNGRRVNPKRKHRKPSGMIFKPSLELCLVSPSAVMLRQKVLNQVGMFDETLPACEDYDLWLRISAKFPVFLLDSPLIVKYGGHDDQLSRAPGLDRFRIRSMTKMLDSGTLSKEQYEATIRVLDKKCEVYANGCRKRGKTDEAAYYQTLPKKYDR